MQKDTPGQLFILSAPSGTGKTSITSRLSDMGLVQVSVSHTTRQPRGNEKPGRDYFFISAEDFTAMRDAGAFLEWAEVYGHYYGTSRPWVEKQLAKGTNVLLEIDCQGARNIAELPQLTPVSIFISPPTPDDLRQRLMKRRQDSPAAVERRLAAAEQEMAQKKYFDYVIINDELTSAVNQAAEVIRRHSAAGG